MICAVFSSTNDDNIIPETDQIYTFPDGLVLEGQENVVTIVLVSVRVASSLNEKTLTFSSLLSCRIKWA